MSPAVDHMSGSTSILNPQDDSSIGHLTLKVSDDQAMKYFEKGIERESHGSMTEAVEYYRKAFKLNENIDKLYRTHKVPHVVLKLKESGGKNTAVKVDEEKVKQINVDKLLDSFEQLNIATEYGESDEDETKEVESSPLLQLPNDIWVSILEVLLITHPESWFNYSITCKKNAFLGLKSSLLWRRLAKMIYPYQRYEENLMFQNSLMVINNDLPIPLDQDLIVPQYDHSWKKMITSRPFIKFLGCYISVVNYYSEGGRREFTNSWSNPVRLITYYRYLRFYPDGTCIKVLSHLEPNMVVPLFLRKNKSITPHYDSVPINSATPVSAQASAAVAAAAESAAIGSRKDSQKIYRGTWTITSEGEVHVSIFEGSVPGYDFHYFFQLKSLGPIFKYNKLSWIRYYTTTKEIDEATGERDISELPLKNEKAFLFLRVRRYHEDTLSVIKG